MIKSPLPKIQAVLAKNNELKLDAQRAFVSYIKFVYLMKNKKVFKVHELNLDSYAASLGLFVTPRVRFLKGKKIIREVKPKKESSEEEKSESESESEAEEEELNQSAKTKPEPESTLRPELATEKFGSDEESDDDDILKLKRRNHELTREPTPPIDEPEEPANKKRKTVSKIALAKRMVKKKIKANKKVVYDEGGDIVYNVNDKTSKEAQEYENENESGINFEKARAVLRAEDRHDKELFRERVKKKHKDRKRKLRGETQDEEENKEDEEVKDDFGTDSGSDNEPDLSWLPDPDKIYGKENNNSEDDSENSETSDGSEDDT